MESTLDDIKKLTHILTNKDEDYSDADSVDSNDLVIDCQRYDFAEKSKTNICNNSEYIINKCSNPLLKEALIYNIEKRKALLEVIKQLEEYLVKLKHTCKEYRSELIDKKIERKGRKIMIKKRLGIPYFKDKNAFPSPLNADYYNMKNKKQIMYSNLDCTYVWSSEDKFALAEAVYKDICEKRLQKIDSEIANIFKNDDISKPEKLTLLKYEKNVFSNKKLISDLVSKWQIIDWSTKDFEQDELKDEELIIKTLIEYKNIDWMAISNSKLNRRHTDSECKALWNFYMNPKFSKMPWTETENEMLTKICLQHNYQDWDSIASDLNTHRSPYQCCVHFHLKLCDKFNRDKWAPEENEYLNSVIEMCRVGNYISWGKVAYFFKHRTKLQIYRHYISCFLQSNIKKGSFSIEEDVLLLTLIRIYDQDITKILPYFPFRTCRQLKERIKTLNTDTIKPWTVGEDARIISFVAKYGTRCWVKLTNEICRSAGCIRHRYRIIQKWFEINPDSCLENIPRRNKANYKNKVVSKNNTIKKAVNLLLQEFETSPDKRNLLNIDYVGKIVQPILKRQIKLQNKNEELKKPVDIQEALCNFFLSTYKNVTTCRVKVTDEFVENAASRIDILLNLLGAKLSFPNLDDIQNHPLLDETDKLIISNLISKGTNETQSSSSNENKVTLYQPQISIPPSIESLIGFRGILCHMHILHAHSRGRYEGYNSYVKSLPHSDFKRGSYFYHRDQLEKKLRSLKLDDDLFFKRLQVMFHWPFIISETNTLPPGRTIKVVPLKQKSGKPGRKTKEAKNYKIHLMNQARFRKRALTESCENPQKKQKTDD